MKPREHANSTTVAKRKKNSTAVRRFRNDYNHTYIFFFQCSCIYTYICAYSYSIDLIFSYVHILYSRKIVSLSIPHSAIDA